MASARTTEFNALCNLTPAMMLRLEILAFQGFSPVSNAFTADADRLGLTPQGRERKEREQRQEFADRMEAIRRQAAAFQRTLDLLEHATLEALRENEEHLRAAREDLQRVRDRAYEVTMPDGTVAKVYRDGDRVRDEAGGDVSPDIVRAEDIGNGHSTWAEHVDGLKRVEELQTKREALQAYQRRIQGARETVAGDDLSAEELDRLEGNLQKDVPAEVQKNLQAATGPAALPARDVGPSQSGLARPFTKAANGVALALTDDDFRSTVAPSVSAPVPR